MGETFMEHAAVYGTGTIGSGLVTLLIGNSLPTVVVGRSQSSLDQCRKAVEQNWNDLINSGLAADGNKAAAMELLTLTSDPSQLRGCTLVFESVSEDPAVKKEVYQTITHFTEEDAVIASTTSSIDAEILAELTNRPESLLIAHPFQPCHIQPLFEIVPHRKTSHNTIERTCTFLESIGRQVVRLNRSVPGFIVNRLAQALFRESIHLIESGVTTAADIDRAVKYAVGMRYASIGLLEYFDDVGFSLESAIAKNVYPDLCSTAQIQKTIQKGLASGNTGLAAGKAIYDWSCKNPDAYYLRKQAPFLENVQTWNLPDAAGKSNS